MTIRTLPQRPNLEFYRRQARDLLRLVKSGQGEAVARFQAAHPRLVRDTSSLRNRLKIADAQLVIAREHGFPSWPKFKGHLEHLLFSSNGQPAPELSVDLTTSSSTSLADLSSASEPGPAPVESQETEVNPATFNKVAGMSTAAVKKGTGKGWSEWIAILDRAGAVTMKHRDIAELLYEQHGCPDWWAQMITVGYEQMRGLRVKHQKCDGTFEANGSKTINVPLEKLFDAVAVEKTRLKCLGRLEITKTTKNKSVRARCGNNPVSINFYGKGDGKSQIQLQHLKLKDAQEAERMKKFWKTRLEALANLLEG